MRNLQTDFLLLSVALAFLAQVEATEMNHREKRQDFLAPQIDILDCGNTCGPPGSGGVCRISCLPGENQIPGRCSPLAIRESSILPSSCVCCSSTSPSTPITTRTPPTLPPNPDCGNTCGPPGSGGVCRISCLPGENQILGRCSSLAIRERAILPSSCVCCSRTIRSTSPPPPRCRNRRCFNRFTGDLGVCRPSCLEGETLIDAPCLGLGSDSTSCKCCGRTQGGVLPVFA